MDARAIDVGAFGGIAGKVLKGSLSGGTLLTGLTLVVSLAILQFILARFGTPEAAPVVTFLAFSFALSRIAVNGASGEWSGSFFSSKGGGSGEVVSVFVRYLSLSCLWIVPIVIVGWRPEDAMNAFGAMTMGMSTGESLSLTTLVITLMAVSPPLFLIVATSAEDFMDPFTPAHWSRTFRGRISDLVLVYVVYLGGLAVVAALLLPMFTALVLQSGDLGKLFGFGALAFSSGLAVDLLGRLSGFFAAFENGETAPEVAPKTAPLGNAPSTERDAPIIVPKAPPMGSGASASSEEEEAGASKTLHVVEGGKLRTPSGKPPLLDARARVQEVAETFERSPDRALVELEDLRAQFAPNPLVLHTLCSLYERANRKPEAAALAPEALAVCLDRGTIRLAAEIFAGHMDQEETFAVDRRMVLTLAASLKDHKSLGQAEAVYRKVIEADPGERVAIKGLLQVGEAYLHQNTHPERAQEIYRFLLEKCGGSPLENYMREGLLAAERRLAG